MTATGEYPDCFAIYEKAHEERFGIRVKCVDYGTAMNLRTRLHRARARARFEERLTKYDHLVCKVREVDDAWWVYIENIKNLDIQPLGVEPASVPISAFRRRF
jgi:hypothetical protein